MLASEQGSLEIVQELIRRGANVNLDDVVRKCPHNCFTIRVVRKLELVVNTLV